MTLDEINKLQPGDAVSLIAHEPKTPGFGRRSFRGQIDMVTENYIRVSWSGADPYRGDIVMRTSPIWESMVKR